MAEGASVAGAEAPVPRPPRVEYLATLSRHSAAVNVVRWSPSGMCRIISLLGIEPPLWVLCRWSLFCFLLFFQFSFRMISYLTFREATIESLGGALITTPLTRATDSIPHLSRRRRVL